jgi:putative NADH-flavin reductase
MAKIVVFGAGGRFGRALISEAISRGHRVTAVVRDPARHSDLATIGITVVTADVRDAGQVAVAAAGHDVAVDAVGPYADSPVSYLADIATSLLDGVARAGVERMLVVGGAGSLEVAPGTRLMDQPDFPDVYQASATSHARSLDALRAAETPVDWVYVSPGAFFDADGPRTGTYRVAVDELLTDANGDSHISYADYAIALVDEIETPKYHRQRIAFAD